MASDYFLKLDGIKGESFDSKHKGEIEIASFSWGLSNAGSIAAGGGSGAGRVSFQDFHFVKRSDSTSPNLMLSCATGQHIKKAVLTVREAANREGEDYIKLTLENVLVSSLEQKADVGEGSTPTEQFSLNFAKIEFFERQQLADGKLGDWQGTSWDIKTNKGDIVGPD